MHDSPSLLPVANHTCNLTEDPFALHGFLVVLKEYLCTDCELSLFVENHTSTKLENFQDSKV